MNRRIQILVVFLAKTTRFAVAVTAISAIVFLIGSMLLEGTKVEHHDVSLRRMVEEVAADAGEHIGADLGTPVPLDVEQEEGEEVKNGRRSSKRLKTILLWNPFFGEPDYGVGGFGTTAFERSSCENTCWLTNNRSELPSADAVVVHVFKMGPQFQNVTMPKRYGRNQIFVFFILESPLRSYKGFFDTGFRFDDVFNLTFTFLDSEETDVYTPLGGLARRQRDVDVTLPSERAVVNKSLVAWFVSNCKAPSARLAYAEELAKYVPVHVYGACGNYSCPPGDITCYNNVVGSYLFYLSFENSFCQDYATEKLFRTLTTNMVPIVYGAANYSKLVPAKAYIDVRSFDSPKHLASYLLRLRETPKAYLRYLTWKKRYSVLQEGDFKAIGFCKLCNILNTPNYPYKTGYDPVEEYWNPDKLCLSGDEERKAVHLEV